MLLCRSVLLVLATDLFLEQMSAFFLPNRLRQKRDVSWLDEEFTPHLPERTERTDLSLGDAGDTSPELEGRHHQPAIFLAPLEHLPVHNHHHHHRHRKNNKRRKAAPLDTIGSSPKSSYRSRKEEPEDNWEGLQE